MPAEKLNISQLASSGFDGLPGLLYPRDVLLMVPDKVRALNFHCAFLIPGKGRVVIYDNPNLYFEGKKAIALGFYECINEEEIAHELFHAVEKEAKKMGVNYLIGPMNGSTWDNHRFSISHNTPGFFPEPYHHLYYVQQWENSGFKIIATYSSCIDKRMKSFEPERLALRQSLLDKIGVVIRSVNIEKYEEEISLIYAFCETTFAANFLYTPISEMEFVQKYLPLQKILDPDFVLIAEDADRNIVSVFFAIADLYNKTIPTIIIKTVARNPRRQFAGLTHLMGNMVLASAKRKGFLQMIHAFMHDGNKSSNVSEKFSGEVFRKYALFGNKIN